MDLKTREDEKKYIGALNKLIIKNNNRPCMEWQ